MNPSSAIPCAVLVGIFACLVPRSVVRAQPPAAGESVEALAAKARESFEKGEKERAIVLQKQALVQAEAEAVRQAEVLATYAGVPFGDEAAIKRIQNALDRIIIPRVDFEDTTLEEAIQFLRLRTAEVHLGDSDPAIKRVNFVIIDPPVAGAAAVAGSVPRRIPSLRMRDVPLGKLLKTIAEMTGMEFAIEPHAIVMRPLRK